MVARDRLALAALRTFMCRCIPSLSARLAASVAAPLAGSRRISLERCRIAAFKPRQRQLSRFETFEVLFGHVFSQSALRGVQLGLQNIGAPLPVHGLPPAGLRSLKCSTCPREPVTPLIRHALQPFQQATETLLSQLGSEGAIFKSARQSRDIYDSLPEAVKLGGPEVKVGNLLGVALDEAGMVDQRPLTRPIDYAFRCAVSIVAFCL